MNWRIPAVALPALCSLVLSPSAPCSTAPQCPFGTYGNSAPATPPGPAPEVPASSSGPASPSGPTGPSTPGPSGPTTGGGTPTADAPSGPTTGGPVPGAPAQPAKTGGRGLPLSFARGDTSKQRLKVDWLHPVPPATQTVGTAAAGPLPLADALGVLWGDDDRPLLVLRECDLCRGTDDALFDRSMQNDRTMLMTKWFRVVRLPSNVGDPGHAFYNVFAGYAFEGPAPHFFLLANPDARPVQFTGMQTQTSLWQGMDSVLQQRYGKDPRQAVKKWLALLDQFDRVDAAMKASQEQLDEVRAGEGPQSSKAKRLQKRIAELTAERDELVAAEAKVRDLHLLSTGKPTEAKASR